MTTTAKPSTSTIAPARMIAPRRRSRPRIAAAIAMTVVFALAGWYFFQSATAQRPYLAVARPIPVGKVIGPGDLLVVYLNGAAGLHPIALAEKAKVLGKEAAVPLVPGTLLTAAEVTDKITPGPGQQLVGINLAPGKLPGKKLQPGDKIELVTTADPNASNDNSGATTTPSSTDAIVYDASGPDPSGNRVVDVIVPAADGPQIAALATANRIVIILASAGG
jgi:hypothetical protein